ncbi:MAG: hypothetical protein ABEK84_08970, partial [Salinibacter sp.]
MFKYLPFSPIFESYVRDFRLGNAEGYGPAPAVEAEALNVSVALWPLFVGSLQPTAVTLEEPIVRYEVTANGATNFEDLGGTTDTTNADGSLLGGIPLSMIQNSNLASRLSGPEGGLGALLEKLVGGSSGEKIVPVTVRLGGTMQN